MYKGRTINNLKKIMANSSAVLVGIFVGVYFGLNMLHVPEPRKVVSLCSHYNIKRIRLSEPNITILTPFFKSLDVSFTFDIPNLLLKKLIDNSAVQNWFNTFVKPYINTIKLDYIVVGEEGHSNILPAMEVLRSLLNANSLHKVKLTTMISYTSLVTKDPPSNGAFNPNIKNNMRHILNFLVQQEAPNVMVNLYPFKKYVYDNRGDINIDYATFGMTDSVQDGRFIYRNLFDAMVDTIYAAIDKLGVEKLKNINVVIGETGWPTDGRGIDTNVTLASIYNQRFITHINSRKGTPRRPNKYTRGFIRSLFNEDARPQGESQYYGLFKDDFTPVYPLFHHG